MDDLFERLDSIINHVQSEFLKKAGEETRYDSIKNAVDLIRCIAETISVRIQSEGNHKPSRRDALALLIEDNVVVVMKSIYDFFDKCNRGDASFPGNVKITVMRSLISRYQNSILLYKLFVKDNPNFLERLFDKIDDLEASVEQHFHSGGSEKETADCCEKINELRQDIKDVTRQVEMLTAELDLFEEKLDIDIAAIRIGIDIANRRLKRLTDSIDSFSEKLDLILRTQRSSPRFNIAGNIYLTGSPSHIESLEVIADPFGERSIPFIVDAGLYSDGGFKLGLGGYLKFQDSLIVGATVSAIAGSERLQYEAGYDASAFLLFPLFGFGVSYSDPYRFGMKLIFMRFGY
ncbi:MAG: hypothetical protein KDD67_14500 [Ignavibacteriae bacterium]|nr:hypothetical protein [Ignavibacteriota bacterium]MCB9215181.1 hypothetical protein [Ignavibacteria bacterium]